MAAFTHIGRRSRFSDGSYGVYSCARQQTTAVRETLFHMGRFYAATREPPLEVDMRVLVGRIDSTFYDIRGGAPRWRPLHAPDDYEPGQALGRALRAGGSNGLVYDSVRHRGGTCLGAFRPRAVGLPIQGAHLTYHWSGRRMDRYFDHETERWIPSAE